MTEKIPKALLRVAGEPFLVHQMRLLHSQGLRKILLCVGYLGEMIKAKLGDGSSLGVQIDYSFDGAILLGTGGALKRALPMLGEQFLVIYGDSYMPVDYSAIVKAFVLSRKPALMTVLENEGRWDPVTSGLRAGKFIAMRRNGAPEMRHIDYGIAVLNAAVFASFPDNVAFDLADVYSHLVSAGQMAAYEVKQRFYEIGSREGLGGTGFPPARQIGCISVMSYSEEHLRETAEIVSQLDAALCEKAVELLATVRARGGRLFILGVGGSAANASHAVNDFRKIAGIECYAPTDNVSELTARTNDEGWASIFAEWLKDSRLNEKDAVLVLSVGGGSVEKNISPNLVAALQLAKERGSAVLGIVGRDGGYTARVADVAVVIPSVNSANVTPHSEAFQAVVWHLWVSHPALKIAETKWESTK